MSRRFLTDIELLGFALLNAKLHPVSADPAGLGVGDAGRVWFNTAAGTSGRLKVWDGTTAIDLLDLGAATGQITASKVSDFDTAVRASRLDQMATPTAPLDLGGQALTNVGAPGNNGDAATKAYVDTALSGLASGQTLKGSVRTATTTNVSITSAPATVDGVTLVSGDVVLLTGQTTTGENGPRVFTAAAAPLARATNWASTAQAALGSYWIVREGPNADTFALLTNDAPITITGGLASPAPTFVFRGAAGASYTDGSGIGLSGTTFSVTAGTGLTQDADGLSVNTARIPRKWSGGIPNASGTVDTLPITVAGAVVTFNHATGNTCPLVEIRYGATLPTVPGGGVVGAKVEVDDVTVDANNVKVTLPAAPLTGNYVFMVVA